MTEYAVALAAFKASDEWIKCADPVSLGASVAMQRFLENRLESAFRAGWLGGVAYVEKITLEDSAD